MLHARLLTYLDEVAKAGSIRKAAERLNVAPSAISRQIMAFEQELGTPVFQRQPRKLALTAAGEIIIRHIRMTHKEMSRARTQIEELKGLRRGEITIAVMSGHAANIVPRTVMEFQDRNSRIRVHLTHKSTGEEILAAVSSGDADVGFGFDFPPRPKIRVLDYASGNLGAVMAPNHPLAGRPSLRMAECLAYRLIVADETMVIRPYLDQLFARLKFEPEFAVETNSIEAMRHAAMMGDAITFLTPFDIEFELRMARLAFVPIHELEQHTQKLMIIGHDEKLTALASVFVDTLKAAVQAAGPIRRD